MWQTSAGTPVSQGHVTRACHSNPTALRHALLCVRAAARASRGVYSRHEQVPLLCLKATPHPLRLPDHTFTASLSCCHAPWSWPGRQQARMPSGSHRWGPARPARPAPTPCARRGDGHRSVATHRQDEEAGLKERSDRLEVSSGRSSGQDGVSSAEAHLALWR